MVSLYVKINGLPFGNDLEIVDDQHIYMLVCPFWGKWLKHGTYDTKRVYKVCINMLWLWLFDIVWWCFMRDYMMGIDRNMSIDQWICGRYNPLLASMKHAEGVQSGTTRWIRWIPFLGPWPMPPASATEPSKVAGGISSGLSKAIREHQTCSIWSLDRKYCVRFWRAWL